LIEGFQNPALAIGAALCVVPLIIHLLNRQRHKPQPWAAMRFVLAAYKRTRRRVQMENLLLLLARMLAVALFALAIARPFASGDSPLAGLREERRDLVLMVDASASTGYRSDVETVHAALVERGTELLDGLDGDRGDRARIALVGQRPRLFSWTDPDDAREILASLTEPRHESADLAATLGAVAEALEEDARSGLGSALEVRLLTDLQQSFFFDRMESREDGDDGGTSRSPVIAEQLARFEALGADVLVEDHGPRALRPANLSVSALTLVGESPRVGAPFDVAVEVRNHGDDDVLAERVALVVGETRLPSQRVDVPARGSAEATFTVVLEEPGQHALVASLEGDRLTVDDSRALSVDAPPPLRILLVNGAPADRIQDDEVGFLRAVLTPPEEIAGALESSSPFDVTVIGPGELDSADSPVEASDVIVLANVSAVPSPVVERLERHVAAGATLLITMGDRASDLGRWSRGLLRADGTGLLPAEPTRVVTSPRERSYFRVATFAEASPELSYFSDEKRRPLLTEVPIYDFVATEPLEGAAVLARLSDARRSPLLVDRPYGAGRTLLWTTTIDRGWNRIPDSGKTFVPLVLELVEAVAPDLVRDRNVGVGETLTITTAEFPRDPVLVGPRGDQTPLEGDVEERGDGRWRLPTIDGDDLDRVGVYEVRATDARSIPIAVRLDAAESDLARAAVAEVESIHPALRVWSPSADGASDAPASSPGASGELWRWLATAALAFLVFESLWGAYGGSRRRRAL